MLIEWLKLKFDEWIERREKRRECTSCETLREQLFIANNEKQKLLEQLIEINNPKAAVQEEKEFEPIQPRIVPWHIKRRMLEAESRKEAELLKVKKEEISEANQKLEEEVMKLSNEVQNG